MFGLANLAFLSTVCLGLDAIIILKPTIYIHTCSCEGCCCGSGCGCRCGSGCGCRCGGCRCGSCCGDGCRCGSGSGC